MAHLHHQVDEVGKPPHKPLDLKKVESMIESSKHLTDGLKPAVLGNDQSTQCSPLQLNDLSIDMEWNELGDSSRKTKNAIKTNVQRNVLNDIFENADRINSRMSNDGKYSYGTFLFSEFLIQFFFIGALKHNGHYFFSNEDITYF